MHKVLVLNSDYRPFALWSYKKAMKKWLGDNDAESVYVVSESSRYLKDGSGNLWNVPSIVALQNYIDISNKLAKYSKTNVYARDQKICQYCNTRLMDRELTVDHVIPRSVWKKKRMKGSHSNFTNVVTSCFPCNSKKGSRTPDQAGMPLLKRPTTITRGQIFICKLAMTDIMADWVPYVESYM
jgi:hypothetical protein